MSYVLSSVSLAGRLSASFFMYPQINSHQFCIYNIADMVISNLAKKLFNAMNCESNGDSVFYSRIIGAGCAFVITSYFTGDMNPSRAFAMSFLGCISGIVVGEQLAKENRNIPYLDAII